MRKGNYVYYLMTIPALALFFAFHTFPALNGIFYSFTNWDGLGPDYHFVGFKNYLNVFKDPDVLNSYLFTFKIAITATILVNALSMLIAMGLNASIKLRNLFRAIYFLPNILSVLIVGFVFNFIFAQVVPDVATKLGLGALASNILGSETWAWVGILILTVWQSVAFNSILYLAGLQTIPSELFEAASIDGAGKWTEFWRITFPMIAPFFTINMVLAMKSFLMIFDPILALTGGGPGKATESISILIYQGGFQGGEFAYETANAVIFLIVIVVISLLQTRFLQKREMDM